MNSKYMKQLHAMASRLPFHVRDYEQATELFVRWRAEQREEDRETLLLWLYIHVQLYVLKRLMNESSTSPTERDQITTAVFTRAAGQIETVREPHRFVHWVNTVCKNTFINERKKARPLDELNEELLIDETRSKPMEQDRIEIKRAVLAAISKLPPSLESIATMRLIKKMSYEKIEEETGLSTASIRAYVAKALAKLRKDPELREMGRDFLSDEP